MITYTYDVGRAGQDRLTGDPLWAVVEYVNGTATGADAHWVRERYARRAAMLYTEHPELHGKPSSVLREHGLRLDTDAEHERETAEHADRVKAAGFDVEYVSYTVTDEARDNGYVNPLHRCRHDYGGYEMHVDLGGLASDEDRTGQTDTVRRSNYRSIRRDFDGVPWVDVSYIDGNTLGAFVADLDADTVDLLVSLAEQYPVYDEEDMSSLEHDEITDSIEQYVIYDVARAMTLEDSERWADLDTDVQEHMIRDFVVKCDGYPEHNGLEVLWDYAALAAYLSKRLS